MTDQEIRVINSAIAWWKGYKPLIYTRKQHLDNPTVGIGGCPSHSRLALAVAGLILERKL